MPFTPFTPQKTGFTAFNPKAGVGTPAPTSTPQTLQGKLAGSSSYIDKVSSEQLGGVQKIASSVKQGGENIAAGTAEGGFKGGVRALKGVAEAGLGTITGAAKTVLAPITPLVEGAVKTDASVLRFLHPQAAALYDKVSSKVAPKINALVEKHPESAGLIGDALNTALLALGGDTDVGAALDTAKGAVKDIPKNIGDTVDTITSKVKEATAPKPDVAKIQETITPKQTVKEAKLAERQGRLVKGKDPTLFKSGKPDTVIPAKSVVQSAKTIAEQIPGAAKMTEPELYTALDKKTTEIATNLKPQMEAVQIKPETIQKINDDWSALKKKQISDANATDEQNVLKRQQKFEDNYLKKSGSENINDLWETRKDYDTSVPDNVKNANELSSESLQQQRSEWIQNRGVLNDAINDAENGLGEESRKAFSDMKDMYNAKEGILSKAKVETTSKPSKISQAYNSKTGKFIRGAVKTGAAIYAGDKVLKGTLGVGL